MASIIPAFADAMQDIALRGHAREVYIWLHQQLDVVTFRAVKHSAIENDLRIRGSAVGWAVARLLERGYIQRGPRDGKLFTYRLMYSRMKIEATDVALLGTPTRDSQRRKRPNSG